MSKNTPGPWEVECKLNVVTPDGKGVTSASTIPRGEREANATLMSASPDMLEALELLLPLAQQFERQASRGTGGKRGGPVFTKARAAIAKAKGENN